MKILVDQNETPFERMKRQGIEWLKKHPSAPMIVVYALSTLESLPQEQFDKRYEIK